MGAEFVGPPLSSPKVFYDLTAKYIKGLVDLIREYGKKSMVHYHGQIREVLDSFAMVNPDAIHTIEAPPIGNCTLIQAREKLGKNVVLVGNIQYDDILRMTQQEMREHVCQLMSEGKTGDFILSPTAGPYEKVIDENMQKNYIEILKSGWEFGKY